MKIHSDTLTRNDLYSALADTGLSADGVSFDMLEDAGSRSRRHAYVLHLASNRKHRREFDLHHKGSGIRRYANQSFQNGRNASGFPYAASYDEWGLFLAELFRLDPDAIAGPYKGYQDFHETTRYSYVSENVR